MNTSQSAHTLNDRIKREAQFSRESYQVLKRVKKLLPEQLKLIKNRFRTEHPAAKSERLALTHQDYQDAIDRYLKLLEESLRARTEWETHRMLLAARQSTRAYRMVVERLRGTE